tara:strand:+ start:1267 stop:1452 length:186 start_codon:yes stop_codon:yes gene_type:complete
MVEQSKSTEKINQAAWEKLKLQIEYHMNQDPNLTDVKINYQLKIPTYGTRNYLNLSAKIND